MDISTKYTWAYLLEVGVVTTGDWNYYGGNWDKVDGEYAEPQPAMVELLKKIKSVGIDWTKTRPPRSTTERVFDGTFVDASETEALIGTLILKDGTQHMVGSKDSAPRFSDYARHLSEMMADEVRFKNLVGD